MDPTQSIESCEKTDARRRDGVDGPGSTGCRDHVFDSDHVVGGGHVFEGDLIIDELLVEEISIDGMCGVY